MELYQCGKYEATTYKFLIYTSSGLMEGMRKQNGEQQPSSREKRKRDRVPWVDRFQQWKEYVQNSGTSIINIKTSKTLSEWTKT